MKTWMLILMTWLSVNATLARAQDPIDNLRQSLVDLEAALRDRSANSESRLKAKIDALELTLGEARRSAAARDASVALRLVSLERTLQDIRLGIGREGSARTALEASLRSEIAQLRLEIARNAKPAAPEMVCSFQREESTNLGTYPQGSLRNSSTTVRGRNASNIVDALSHGCTACGPRDYKDIRYPEYFAKVTCSLIGCGYVANGAQVATWDEAQRLAPEGCRALPPARRPAPVRRLVCSMMMKANIFHSGGSNLVEVPVSKTGETLAGAVAGVCAHCRDQVRAHIGGWTNARARLDYGCSSLSCEYEDNKTAVAIPANLVPAQCHFQGR